MSILSNAQSGKTYIQYQVEGLKKSLQHYQKINESDWYFFACDSCLYPGEKSNLIPLLRSNLILSGDLKTENNIGTTEYDSILEISVKKFQQRHGLVEDGVIGTKTIDAMNIPISIRIHQIKVSIAKWDSLNKLVSEPFILVNIPDYSLTIIDSNKISYQTKVIVGRITHQTPVLISQLNQLVLNPSWNVPQNIAVKEILPMLKDGDNYLERNHMKVFTFYKGRKIEANSDTINWKNNSERNFRYLFEQEPGKWNALGKIKFIFPNPYQVYLHDTPEKYLFHHPIRTYSHGCIRLENPEKLADWLLRNDPIYKNTVADYLKNNSKTKTISLTNPVPIAISYFTTWISEDGNLQFRDNIYQLDESFFLNQDI